MQAVFNVQADSDSEEFKATIEALVAAGANPHARNKVRYQAHFLIAIVNDLMYIHKNALKHH